MIETPKQADIIAGAITSRASIRAFSKQQVSPDVVRRILEISARAPSGTNMQPWQVYVTMGERRQRLCDALMAAYNDNNFTPENVYDYYPKEFFEPYLSRRRQVGWELYGLLGIEKGEKEKMKKQQGRNYIFFDAPVGLIFTIDEKLKIGSWLDYGMFLQNIMIAARGFGLDTCPQAAFAPMHKIIKPVLDIPDSQIVVCAMALGYKDEGAIENTLKTPRASLDDFVKFL